MMITRIDIGRVDFLAWECHQWLLARLGKQLGCFWLRVTISFLFHQKHVFCVPSDSLVKHLEQAKWQPQWQRQGCGWSARPRLTASPGAFEEQRLFNALNSLVLLFAWCPSILSPRLRMMDDCSVGGTRTNSNELLDLSAWQITQTNFLSKKKPSPSLAFQLTSNGSLPLGNRMHWGTITGSA